MLITAAKYEDSMKTCKNKEEVIKLMLDTLDSLGYEFGNQIAKDLLNAKEK